MRNSSQAYVTHRIFLGTVAMMLFALPSTSSARQFDASGRVVHIVDGDTIIVLLDGNTKIDVRLSSIDAPENEHRKHQPGRIGQPFSERSSEYLASLIKGKMVDMHCFEADQYKRQVCEVFIAGVSVNRAMVAAGWAWANRASNSRYLRDKDLIEVEASARASKAGLWARGNPVTPWEWRKDCWGQGVCN